MGGVGAVGDGEHAAGRRAAERRLAGVDEADVLEVQRRPSLGRKAGHRLCEHPRLPEVQGSAAGEGDGLVEGAAEVRVPPPMVTTPSPLTTVIASITPA